MAGALTFKYRINPYTARLDVHLDITEVMGMWGPIELKTIAAGVVTLDGPGRYAIDTEGAAASDTVHTIQGLNDGNEVILRAASSVRTVVLATGTGNLRLQSKFSLDNALDTARLVCDASGYVVESGGRSDNG